MGRSRRAEPGQGDDEVFRLIGFQGRSTVDTSALCIRLFYEAPRVK